MAITVGTPVNASTASGASLALNMGTRSLNDVVLLAGSINNTSNEDAFSSWAKTAGTSVISAIQVVEQNFGSNLTISVAVCRVTTGGTLTITGTLIGSRRWLCTGIPMTGVPSGLAITDVYNPSIGLLTGATALPTSTPAVAPETIGDRAFGILATEGLRTCTVTTSPANWTEHVDQTIGGSGGDTADASLHVESFATTTLNAISSAPTINSSTDLRQVMLIMRASVPPVTPRRYLNLLGAGI